MNTPSFRLRIPILLTLLAIAAAGCIIPDNATNGPQKVPVPTVQVPTSSPSCKPATTADEVGNLLYNAQVTEQSQSFISITIFYPTNSQWEYFARPDKFRWKIQAGDIWEEAITIGGSSFGRSSTTPSWTPTPLLNPSAATAMKQFTDPPKKLNSAALIGLFGINASDKIEGRLVEFVQASETCVYQISIKSGDRILYQQKTWIGANDNLRYKFEATDATGAVIETRLFDYSPFTLTAPAQ